jgi:beta-hydroxylase
MASDIIKNLVKFPGIAVLRTFDFLVQTFALNKEVLPEQQFPFAKILANNRLAFLQEYERLRSESEIHSVKDFYKVDTDLQYDNNWKAVPIILFNYAFKESVRRCPETFRVISQRPGCCGAMFSVLAPGKHIPPHRGIYKGVWRCLLTLKVEPGADCWIRVNEQKLYFKEGNSIVFDETAEHEVMNASSSPRIVLYLDFYRKLPFPLNYLNNIVFGLLRKSPFVKTICDEYARIGKTSYESFNSVPPSLP